MQRPFGHQHHVSTREKWRITNVEYGIATVAVSDRQKNGRFSGKQPCHFWSGVTCTT